MARTTIDAWNADFLNLSPSFDSIREVSLPFVSLNSWPTLAQYSAELSARNVCSCAGLVIQSVGQGGTPEKFEDYYESRIYLKGELQTRLDNWHDFFNAMCWLQFPKIKSSLNALHFENSQHREPGTNRKPIENAITLFDECGAIIVSDDDSLLQLVREHKWKELFYDNKEAFGQRIQCYVFGHAMHEKSLTPYLGMTAHSIILKKDTAFFMQSYSDQLRNIDKEVSRKWMTSEITKTKDLQPFPLLGIEGWWNKAQDETFYANVDYFRKKTKANA